MLSYLFKSSSSSNKPTPSPVDIVSPIASFAQVLAASSPPAPIDETEYLVVEIVSHLWNEREQLLVDAACLPKTTLFKSLQDACHYGRALARSHMTPDPDKYTFYEHKYDNPSLFNNVIEEYQVRSFLEPSSVVVRIFVSSIIPIPSSSNDSQRTVFYSPSSVMMMSPTTTR